MPLVFTQEDFFFCMVFLFIGKFAKSEGWCLPSRKSCIRHCNARNRNDIKPVSEVIPKSFFGILPFSDGANFPKLCDSF